MVGSCYMQLCLMGQRNNLPAPLTGRVCGRLGHEVSAALHNNYTGCNPDNHV